MKPKEIQGQLFPDTWDVLALCGLFGTAYGSRSSHHNNSYVYLAPALCQTCTVNFVFLFEDRIISVV
jgi:hypothetical protein